MKTTDEAFERLEEVDAGAEEDDGAGPDDDAADDEAAAGVGAAAGATGAGKSRTREYSADTLASSLIRMLRGERQPQRHAQEHGAM